MTQTALSPELIKQTTDFHGHWCPGLAIGIRAAEWAMKEMGTSADEEIVAVVETDMCGVDAIQFLVGCTFGKGNLIHKDYGKNAFSFYRCGDGKSARLVGRPALFGEAREILGKLHRKMQEEGLSEEEQKQWSEARAAISAHVMGAPLEELFDIKETTEPVPQKARILSSVVCESCGETVMETRVRRMHEKLLCMPCFESAEKR